MKYRDRVQLTPVVRRTPENGNKLEFFCVDAEGTEYEIGNQVRMTVDRDWRMGDFAPEHTSVTFDTKPR